MHFECDCCVWEIGEERERQAERPPLVALALGWIPDDVKQCSNGPVSPPLSFGPSILSPLPPQISTLPLLFAPSPRRFMFSPRQHTLHIYTLIFGKCQEVVILSKYSHTNQACALILSLKTENSWTLYLPFVTTQVLMSCMVIAKRAFWKKVNQPPLLVLKSGSMRWFLVLI